MLNCLGEKPSLLTFSIITTSLSSYVDCPELADGGNGVDHWAAPALSQPDDETVGVCSPPGEDTLEDPLSAQRKP